jgi:hypothetical protein
MTYAINTDLGTPSAAINGRIYATIGGLMDAVRQYYPKATENFPVVTDGTDGGVIAEIAEVA